MQGGHLSVGKAMAPGQVICPTSECQTSIRGATTLLESGPCPREGRAAGYAPLQGSPSDCTSQPRHKLPAARTSCLAASGSGTAGAVSRRG